ncbi:MAG TPA: (2Fe-2S)-binding protein [Casimicrobiaceae bacterium]|nr:(2Fe-2S)-binding protein [Casimicrobiaceae bacterium]
MYVCLCNGITDRQIAQAAQLGARSPEDLAQGLGVGLGCGRCVACAEAVLREAVSAATLGTDKLAA